MNVYDFDQTIFYPDSSHYFCRFCLGKYPRLRAKVFPGAVSRGLGVLTKRRSTGELKEQLFSFLNYIPDPDAEIEEFWQKYWGNIQPWYFEKQQPGDLIISASPDFLVRPAAERLGAELIATPMDRHTGKIMGVNCHDEEKVRRFYQEYPGAQIDDFYSDSLHDSPLAALAKRAFIVKKCRLSPWPEIK